MVFAGVLLAFFTRGAPPADSPNAVPNPYVARSVFQQFYLLALTLGLILFYVAIPFVVVGILGVMAAMLYALFCLRHVPGKAVVIVVVVGIGMVWAVLKSLFARPPSGSFNLLKTEADCPRFHAAIREVAEKVETRPVDAVYLGPGSEISVKQEGRGPFGMFGVKCRVLTVGMANLRYLTVGELKAVLAHEYAHFSHRDTAYADIQHMMAEGKAFINLYEAFASYRDEQLTDEERRKMFEEFIDQKASMFASHPAVRERIAALAAFPNATRTEDAPAVSLFDQPEELEKELTEFLTGFLASFAIWRPPRRRRGEPCRLPEADSTWPSRPWRPLNAAGSLAGWARLMLKC